MSSYNSIIDGIEYTKNIEDKFINIKVPLSKENQIIIEQFFNDLMRGSLKQLSKNWFVDEDNCSIISPNKTYFLTKKESIFIKLLLKNKTVTYEEMMCSIWNSDSEITSNAIKVFVKNFKKKIPPLLLKNLNGIGYRLINLPL